MSNPTRPAPTRNRSTAPQEPQGQPEQRTPAQRERPGPPLLPLQQQRPSDGFHEHGDDLMFISLGSATAGLRRRCQSAVLIDLDGILDLSFVVPLLIRKQHRTHLLVLDGHIDVQRLALLQRVVLLLAVVLVLRLVQVLLVLLQSDLEIQGFRTLLETNADVGLLAVLLDSHHEVTRRIQHGLDHLQSSPIFRKPHRRTIVTNHGGSKDLLVVVNELHEAALSSQDNSQRTHPNLVGPTSSTVTHTRISWRDLVDVASANTAEDLLKYIVLHNLYRWLANLQPIDAVKDSSASATTYLINLRK